MKYEFREFLRVVPAPDTPAGDFILDAKADRRMPAIENWPQLRSYLEYQHGVTDMIVLVAARRAWSIFRLWQKSQA